MTTSNSSITQSARLNKVEDSVNNLATRHAELEADVKHLNVSVTALSGKIDNVIALISGNSKTEWSTLGTWAGVMLVLVAMWTQPMISDIIRNTESAKENNVRNVEEREEIQNINVQLAVLDVKLESLTSHFKEHSEELDHPWGVVNQLRLLEAAVNSIETNRFDSAQGALLQAKIESAENLIERILDKMHLEDQD